MAKHFIKTVTLFTGMILIGLLGIFLVSHFGLDKAGDKIEAQVAK